MASLDLSSSGRISRVELFLVIAVTLAGFALRAAYPSRLAVEHFDEGVYASNIWFDQSLGYRYPNQHLYAPPLLPALIELVFTLFGPSNAGAMVVSIVAGSLTVPLLWWVGRRWFGPAAGLAAMTLCACSDLHIFFSRTALTDVLLCFFLVAAVYLIWEALTTPTPLRLFAAGLVTALAWWTKYSGWLPLAIAGGGIVVWKLASWRRASSVAIPLDGGGLGGGAVREESRATGSPPTPALPPRGGEGGDGATGGGFSLASLSGRFAIVAAVAFGLWLPFVMSLSDKGGYVAVAANHRGYVVGWSGWFGSIRQQFENLTALEGPLSSLSLAISFLFMFYDEVFGRRDAVERTSLWNRIQGWKGIRVLLKCALAGIVIMEPLNTVALCAWFALTGIWMILSPSIFSQVFPAQPAAKVAGCLLTAAFIGLFVTTPTYVPFVRLTLPLQITAILLVSFPLPVARKRAVDTPNRRNDRGYAFLKANPQWEPVMQWYILIVFALCWVILGKDFVARGIPAWQPRTGLANLARPILADACRHAGLDPQKDIGELVIDTYGEPALLFQLGLAGVETLFPVSHLGFARPEAPPVDMPAFVVIGSHARQTAGFDKQFAESKARLELVAEYEYHPSDLVLLDNRDPERRPEVGRPRPIEKLELYRIR